MFNTITLNVPTNIKLEYNKDTFIQFGWMIRRHVNRQLRCVNNQNNNSAQRRNPGVNISDQFHNIRINEGVHEHLDEVTFAIFLAILGY